MPETRPSAPVAPSGAPIPAKIPSPPAAPSAPAAISAPSAPAAAQRAAVAGPAASAGPAPPKAVEVHRSTLATRPPPQPLPQRSAMPPPIAPGANRGNVTRLPEKHPQGSAAATSNGFPTGPNSRPQTADAAAEPEVVRAGTEPGPAGVKPEVRVTPQAAPKAPSPPAEAPMSVEPEPPAGAPRREPPGPTPPAQPLGADQAASAPARTPAKAEDPFAGLESLEAEMARLLGREK